MAARECDETHAAGEANLGAVYLRMGRISEALELLNGAAEALPGDPGVRVNLGNALADGGHWAQAREAFDAALAIDPEHCPARFQRGRVRAEMLDFVGAAEDFESVTRLEPENAVAYRNLARARGRAGDHAAAIAALRRGLERLPRDARLCQQLAWSLATSPDASVRDGEEALRLARELVAQRPNDPELSEVLAAASAEVGDFAAALRYEGAALAQLDDLRPEPPALEVLREKMLVRLETYRAGEAWREQ
jgi:tetratricopeptide (TPR) repeat protein